VIRRVNAEGVGVLLVEQNARAALASDARIRAAYLGLAGESGYDRGTRPESAVT
jgi:ABC-type branched-subunit amino acid transport system ATPase component